MKAKHSTWRRVAFVSLGAVVLSTLGIQAADYTNGITTRLLGSAHTSGVQACGEGEVMWRSGDTVMCVDAFEASPAPDCGASVIGSAIDTQSNIALGCGVVSAEGQVPWRYVTYTEARQLCARTGKRLLSAHEWYELAVGQSDTATCVTNAMDGAPAPTGSQECRTPSGVADLVGNLWEWVADTTNDGVYEGRPLPESGYVDLVDASGVVVRTTTLPNPVFGNDYAWTEREGIHGMLRGGFYQGGDDAGIFAQNLSVALDFNAAGVGFRCGRDL